MIGVDKIKNSLSLLKNKNNSEKQEVEIYIEFLKLNKNYKKILLLQAKLAEFAFG